MKWVIKLTYCLTFSVQLGQLSYEQGKVDNTVKLYCFCEWKKCSHFVKDAKNKYHIPC